MYVRTESDEIIEIHDDYYHPDTSDIRAYKDDCYSELYERLYDAPKVKPVKGTPSWQLLIQRFKNNEEICISTFDTVKRANNAIKSFKRAQEFHEGWDAIEYRESQNGEGSNVEDMESDIDEVDDMEEE